MGLLKFVLDGISYLAFGSMEGSVTRQETGPIQIDDDRPGIYMRGDDAKAMMNALLNVGAMSTVDRAVVNDVVRILQACAHQKAKSIPIYTQRKPRRGTRTR